MIINCEFLEIRVVNHQNKDLTDIIEGYYWKICYLKIFKDIYCVWLTTQRLN